MAALGSFIKEYSHAKAQSRQEDKEDKNFFLGLLGGFAPLRENYFLSAYQ